MSKEGADSIRVLRSQQTFRVATISNEYSTGILKLILTVTDPDGSSKTIIHNITSNRLFKESGIEAYFEQSNYFDFDKSLKLVFSGPDRIQNAFSFKYYGMTGDFNSAPTDIDRWR